MPRPTMEIANEYDSTVLVLDPNGTVDLKVFKNSNNQEFYLFSDENNFFEGYTFIRNEKASKKSRSKDSSQLEVFSIQIPGDQVLQQFDTFSFAAYRKNNNSIVFRNSRSFLFGNNNIIPIVAEQKGNYYLATNAFIFKRIF